MIEVASPTPQFMPLSPEGVSGIFLFLVISIKIVCWKCVFLTPIFFGTFLFFKHPLEEIKRENLGSRF